MSKFSRSCFLALITSVVAWGGIARAENLVERVQEELVLGDGTSYTAPTYLVILYRGGPGETWAVADYGWQPGKRGTHAPLNKLRDGKPFTASTCYDDPELQSATPVPEGVETVSVEVPRWCKGYKREFFGSLGTYGDVATYLGGEIPQWPENLPLHGSKNPVLALRELQSIGVAACDRRLYGPRQRRVANWLQQWLNTYRVSLAETQSLLADLVARPDFGQKDLCRSNEPFASTLLCSALDWGSEPPEFSQMGLPAVYHVPLPQVPFFQDWLEQGGPTSVLEKLAFIDRLGDISHDNDFAAGLGTLEASTIDFDAFKAMFDVKSPLESWVVERAIPILRTALLAPFRAIGVEAVAARKTEYDKLTEGASELFDVLIPLYVASHRLEDFGLPADAKEHPARLEASRIAAAECGPRLDALLTKALEGRDLSATVAMKMLVAEPVIEMLLQGISRCESSRFQPLAVREHELDGPYARPPWVTGWRAYVTRLWSFSGLDLASIFGLLSPSDPKSTCARKGQIDSDCVDFPGPASELLASKVTKTEDGISVEWASNFWMEDIEECTETKQVDRIRPDGTVQYRQKCWVARREKRVNDYEPVVFAAHLESVLKPGQVLRYLPQRGRAAVLAAAYKDLKTASTGVPPIVVLDTIQPSPFKPGK